MFWFILATCSALLSAVSAVLQKKVLFRLSALEFSFLVSIAIIILSLLFPFYVDVFAVSSTALSIIIVKSVIGGVAFLLVMLSLQKNQISNALPLLGLTPAVTAVLSLIILGEELKSIEWMGLGLMIIGAYLLEQRHPGSFLRPLFQILKTKNYYYIFGAVGLFAVSSIFDKMLVSESSVNGIKTDPLVVLFFQHIIYTFVFLSVLVFNRNSLRTVVTKSYNYIVLIIAIALLTILYRFTQLEATKLAPVALVLAVKRTSILYASFFGGKLFSEERLKIKLIGALFIVGAGFIILRNVG